MPLRPPARLGRADIEALRSSLQARAKTLRAELATALHSDGESLAIPGHLGETDDAVADLETDIEVASVQRDAAELEAIEFALAHIDTANFGVCIDCGRPIARERLFAQPAARRCLACGKRAEARLS